MIASFPDEYQDDFSVGSLVSARRYWLDLSAADALPIPQRFTFIFDCPTRIMALGLRKFLQYTPYAGFVRSTERVGTRQRDSCQVLGTTYATRWSLSSLEHLFMSLRRAGARYGSALVTLDVLPTVRDRSLDESGG